MLSYFKFLHTHPIGIAKKAYQHLKNVSAFELKVKEELIEFTETKAKYAKASNNNPKVPDSSDMEEVIDSD